MSRKRRGKQNRKSPATTDRGRPRSDRSPPGNRTFLLGVGAVLIPLLLYVGLPYWPLPDRELELYSGGSRFAPSPLPWTEVGITGNEESPPRITNVQILDFDRDQRLDLIACDARRNVVAWYRQDEQGGWEERVLGGDLVDPAHATVVDLDQDGDLDVIVSELGNIWPSDSVVGRVTWLEQVQGEFRPRVLLEDVRRVADTQADDLDGDGDVDLVVAVFGYAHGRILWLENLGNETFHDHTLMVAAGAIHVPLGDYDGDGDTDIATVVSQQDEEVWAFENLGQGEFRQRLLFGSPNFDLGSGGLVRTDLDGDGDQDLLLPVGDNLEDVFSYPQPYHGCYWLDNEGDWQFRARRIASFGGTYAAAPGDLDGDGDQDVALVSMVNEWEDPRNASIIWLENDGRSQFTPWQIAQAPTQLTTVACGDLDGDGRDDIAAGGLYLNRPYDRMRGITLWTGGGGRSR